MSHIAQCAGVAALSRPEYKEAVIRTVKEELVFMKKELAKLPLTLYDGRANYLFFRTPGSDGSGQTAGETGYHDTKLQQL